MLEFFGCPTIIRIEKGAIATLGEFDTTIATCGHACIFKGINPEPIVRDRPHTFQGVIRRPIIDHQNLEILAGLSDDRLDCADDRGGSVKYRNDHGHQRPRL